MKLWRCYCKQFFFNWDNLTHLKKIVLKNIKQMNYKLNFSELRFTIVGMF